MSNDHASVQIHEFAKRLHRNQKGPRGHTHKKSPILISKPKDISLDLSVCISGAANQVSTGILQFNY